MHYKSLLFFTLLFTSNALLAQKLSYTEKSTMVQASYNVQLDKQVLDQIKDYTEQKACNAKIINKNVIHIRVIYNEKLNRKDRLDYCDYLDEIWRNDHCTLPIDLIQEQRKKLRSKNNK